MKKIKEFFLEESKVNKGSMILVCIDENGEKWVCSGNHWNPTYATKYEDSFDTKSLENTPKPTFCTCDFPIIRISESGGEYCGDCGKDLD